MTADGAIDTGAMIGTDTSDGGEQTFSVPEAFADKPWAQNIKSNDDMFTQMENLQGLIGKKSIPGSDATDEQLQEFYAQLTPESYELNLPEGVEAEINQEEQDAYKEFFKANGISQKQAQNLYEFYVKSELGKQPTEEQLAEKEKASDVGFDKALDEKYGSKEKGDEAVRITLQYALEHSPETKAALAELPNEQLLAVVDIVNSMHGKIPGNAEDTSPAGRETGSGGTSIDQKVKEANKIRMSKEIKDPFHPENTALREKLKNLDDEIRKAIK